MSEYFAQAVLFLSIMQVAESIERVKAIRVVKELKPSSLDEFEDLQHVPFCLRSAYRRMIEASLTEKIPFNGKEFLLSFDPCINL